MTRSFLLSLFLSLFISRCAHQVAHYDLIEKQRVVFRFQNMLGLQTNKVGCSLGNLGGIELMNQHAASHPVDLTFQIGPSFYPLITGPFVNDRLAEERKKVWQALEKQKVAFYSVDALDLAPGFEEFKKSAGNTAIELMSANIRFKEKSAWPFKPFLVLSVSGKKVAVLSFSESSPEALSEKTPWVVNNPVEAFSEVRKQIPNDVSVIYILGSLQSETRKSIAKASKEPLLFLGGTRFEKNSTALTKIQPNAFWAKSPDYGMGYSELTLGGNSKTTIGGLGHEFRSAVLNEDAVQKPSCEPTPES